MKDAKCHFRGDLLLEVEAINWSEAIVQTCSVKMVFLEISQNFQENTCARVSFLIKLQASGLRPATLLKKSLWHRYFPGNFVKFPRTPFLTEHLWWLFLFGKATNAWKKNSSKKLKSALFKKRADGSDMIS